MSIQSTKNIIKITDSTNSTSNTTGAITVSGGIGVSGNIQSNGYLGVGGAVGNATYPLNVAGAAKISSYLGINGAIGSGTYPLNVSGNFNCSGTAYTSSTLTQSADLNLSGNTGLGGITSPSYPLDIGNYTYVSNRIYANTTDPTTSEILSLFVGGHLYSDSIATLGATASSAAFVSNNSYYITAPLYGTQSNISDIRTKQNIQLINNNNSLSLIRNIIPKKYNYIDDNTKKINYGFIAQEIQELIPGSISKNISFIPDIFTSGIISDSPYNTDYSIITINTETVLPTEIIQGCKLKITIDGVMDIIEVLDIIDNRIFSTKKLNKGNVFIYGRQILDFHSINKSDIYITMISAFKELDTLVQNKRKLNIDLQNKIKVLELK